MKYETLGELVDAVRDGAAGVKVFVDNDEIYAFQDSEKVYDEELSQHEVVELLRHLGVDAEEA